MLFYWHLGPAPSLVNCYRGFEPGHLSALVLLVSPLTSQGPISRGGCLAACLIRGVLKIPVGGSGLCSFSYVKIELGVGGDGADMICL